MTELEGFDYTSVPPSVLKSDGAKFVMRYLSSGSKGLTVAEKNELHADGIAIGVVYETTGVTFEGGEKAGLNDGSQAKVIAQHLGVPVDAPIYFAIDTDTSAYSTVNAYLKGCQEGCTPYVAKLYAGAHVVDQAPSGGHWQTYAWSGGEISSKADLYQYQNGATLDHDRTLGSTLEVKNGWLVPASILVPVTGPPSTTPPTPIAPAPTPVPAPVTTASEPVAEAALKHAEAEIGKGGFHNECLIFVREQYGLAADGREPTAAAAWNDCPADKRHASHDGKTAPAGVPFVFSGGATGAGHIVITLGDNLGGCISSDWPNDDGTVGETTIDAILAKWTDLHPEGWMEELEGHVVYAPAPAPTAPPVAGGTNTNDTNWSNFPGTSAFVIGKANPAVWILGVRLKAAGFDKHLSIGKAAYAPSHVFSLHDLLNVKDFQASLGWTGSNADGYPGPSTWAHLGMATKWVTE